MSDEGRLNARQGAEPEPAVRATGGEPAGPAGSDLLTYRSARGRWVLLAAVLASGVAAIDATAVGVALPTIGRDFQVPLAPLQWVVTAYTLTLAGLLLVAGALGDRYGRRRVLVTGVAAFAAASLLCGIAPNTTTLITARALQGVGAALLTPGSLAILQATFVPQDRAKAIGAWSGLGGVATALGPFLGGWLVDSVSWRLIFFINLPLAAAVVTIALRHIPETRDPQAAGKVDLLGGALVTLGLVGLTYGLIQGSASGWSSPGVVAALAAGVVLLAGFMVQERRSRQPVLPLSLFASRQFTATNVVTFAVYGALGGALFLLPIQLQQVSGYSALAAGTALLPVTLVMLLLSARSGALAARIGPRLQMSVGPVVAGAGLALLSRIDAEGNYLTEVLPAMVVFGLGLAIVVAPLTATALDSAPPAHAGVASAVNNDIARTAGLIAVAVLPAAAGVTGDAYLHAEQFSAGFRSAAFIAAGLCAFGGILSLLTIRNPRVPPAAAPTPPAARHCALEGPPLNHPCERRAAGQAGSAEH